MAPSNVCFWEVQASVWTGLFFQIFYIHSLLLWFFVFNLNCLIHSQWKLWRRKKFVTVHLHTTSVWNLYIISLYFQNVYLKRRRPWMYWLHKTQWRQRALTEVTKLICDRGARTTPRAPGCTRPHTLHWSVLKTFQVDHKHPQFPSLLGSGHHQSIQEPVVSQSVELQVENQC